MSDLSELLSRLRVAEIVLDNLPQDQSDGSRLIIDSTEAANIYKAIADAVEVLTKNNEAQGMLEAAKPLIKWMVENSQPHFRAIVTASDVELIESIDLAKTLEFLGGKNES